MIALIRSELIKVRTTRTVWALLGATAALTVLAVAGAVIVGSNSGVDLESESGVGLALHVSGVGAVFVLVLGAIVTAGEFRHGTATSTFLTTPIRWRVLGAKVITASALGLAFGALSATVALAVASHTYQMQGYTLPVDSTQLRQIVIGAIVYAALFGALGASLGSLVRNQVAAIVGALAWLLIAEQIVANLAPDIGKYLPASAGRALVLDPEALLSQQVAMAVLAGYAVAVFGLAVAAEWRRDAQTSA